MEVKWDERNLINFDTGASVRWHRTSEGLEADKLFLLELMGAERGKVAHRLGDELCPLVLASAFYLDTLKNSKVVQKSTRDVNLMKKAAESLSRLEEALRDICFDLFPSALESAGLQAAVRELARKVSFTHNISVQLHLAPSNLPLKCELETNFYWIIREFVGNAILHGLGDQIKIQMHEIAEPSLQMCLMMSDNGCGFNPQESFEGYGLPAIKARVEALGGKLNLWSRLGEGTKLNIHIPVSIE